MDKKQELIETEIGRIPSDWKIEKLKNLCNKIGSGATPRGGANIYVSSGIALIRSQNIYDDGFNKQGLAFINEDAAEKLKNVEVREHDVLLNITGDSICRASIVPKEVLPARVNQHVSILRTNEKLYYRFLFYFLSLNKTKSKLLSYDAGGTRQALTKSMLEEFHVPLPEYEEQVELGDFFWTITEKIALNRSMNSTLEAIGQALFKHWFVDFEFPNEEGKPYWLSGGEMVETELGEVPRGWRVGTLGDIIENFDSKRIPLSSRERASRKGIYPYYGAASIMDYVDDYIFDGIYVLMGEDGTVIDENENPILQYVWGKIWVNNHAHVIQGKDGIPTEYISLLLKQMNIKHLITGAVQPKINQRNMNSLTVIIPPKDTLSSFSKLIIALFEKYRANSEEVKLLSQIRDALLPKLMSGEIRVKPE